MAFINRQNLIAKKPHRTHKGDAYKVKMKVAQSCPTLWDPMNYGIQGILHAKILEWVAIPFSRGSSWPRNWTGVSCITGVFVTNWAMREARACSAIIYLKTWDLRKWEAATAVTQTIPPPSHTYHLLDGSTTNPPRENPFIIHEWCNPKVHKALSWPAPGLLSLLSSSSRCACSSSGFVIGSILPKRIKGPSKDRH